MVGTCDNHGHPVGVLLQSTAAVIATEKAWPIPKFFAMKSYKLEQSWISEYSHICV